MKKLNLMVIVTVFTMILLCSCAQNNDVMASVNGIDIKKSDYEVHLKSNEIMAELMTEDINNSDFTSEEKNTKIMEIKEKCSTDKETIINSMIETAFIDSKYDSITHEQAKSEIEKQMSNLDAYADEYPQVAANGKIMDEYIKRMGITKDEYIDLAADSYISYVNKQKAKETSVYKGYKQDKIEMRGDRAEMSDFPLYLNTVAGGLDRRDQTIGGFSFVVKIYAVPVVEIIG